MVDGYRESAQSWKELLLDLKRRGGLETGPELAVGDGALGFWKALREVYGETRVQRCWVHKTANVLNQMPKSLQAKAKGHLHDIWMAETRADAEAAFDFFIAAYGAKYHKAAERLVKPHGPWQGQFEWSCTCRRRYPAQAGNTRISAADRIYGSHRCPVATSPIARRGFS